MKLLCVYPLTLLLMMGCGSHERATEHKKLPVVDVEVFQVKLESVPMIEPVVGTVAARQQASVSAKVSGRIVSFLATVGKGVTQGDVLAEIEANETRAALDRAQAARARAEKDFNRYQSLMAESAITQAEFDQIEAQYRMASASVREIERLLENSTVRAPFDGVIVRKESEVGNLATPGQPLFIIETPGDYRLEMNIAESLVGSLTPGDPINVAFRNHDSPVVGNVGEMTPAGDPASRTFLVKLDLPEDANVRVGQFGRAEVPRGDRQTLFVPMNAIVERGQMNYVFTADGDRARLRIVRLARASSDRVEVLAGLEADTTVILKPPSTLQDGQPIKVRS